MSVGRFGILKTSTKFYRNNGLELFEFHLFISLSFYHRGDLRNILLFRFTISFFVSLKLRKLELNRILVSKIESRPLDCNSACSRIEYFVVNCKYSEKIPWKRIWIGIKDAKKRTVFLTFRDNKSINPVKVGGKICDGLNLT